jgi:hypothetical protein
MAEKGSGLLVVMIEIDPEHEQEFLRCYYEGHFPEGLESPGVPDSEDGKRIFPLSDWGLQVSQYFTKMVEKIYQDPTGEIPPRYQVHAAR